MELHYFVAITLPNHIKEMLYNYKEDMQEELQFRSWVHKEDYHITLSFLGECNGGTIRGNKEWITNSCRNKRTIVHVTRFFNVW
ncbi:2'-5' RNA ligase family protein [Bacillus cereus]